MNENQPSQIEQLRRARNFDELAERIEPLAMSMATLADDLREAMSQAQNHHNQHYDQLVGDYHQTSHEVKKSIQELSKATNQVNQITSVASRPNWWKYVALCVVGLLLGITASYSLLRPSSDQLAYQVWGSQIDYRWRTGTLEDRKQIANLMGWKEPTE